MPGWYTRHCSVTMHSNGSLAEARQHRMHHIMHMFSPQHTYATDFFLKMWHDSNEKGILHIFSRQILAQAVKNGHDHNYFHHEANRRLI